MRTARMKVSGATGYYHCVSRVVNGDFVFGALEKEAFLNWMRKYAEFCGVRVVTYCVMSNHFHVLVEVPERPSDACLPRDEELLRRLALVSSQSRVNEVRRLLERFVADGNGSAAMDLRESLYARMWDVSTFMQQLKGRYTQWFNRKHGRRGTLWEERFKSVLVEGSGLALATMAAYIDLNPVRAGIVDDPKEYRWSGYAEAVAGKLNSVAGLSIVGEFLGLVAEGNEGQQAVLKVYRQWLYLEGYEVPCDPEQGTKGRRGMKVEDVEAVLAKGGVLSRAEVLRVRVRYFCDGAILGSRDFVQGVLEHRTKAMGHQRRTGPARMKGRCWDGLHTLRNLRSAVYG